MNRWSVLNAYVNIYECLVVDIEGASAQANV
jgi:hypothetical protein